MSYQSSIINKYGDTENVKSDIKKLNDILQRQSKTLLIDVIAEYVGQCAIKFNYTLEEKNRVVISLTNELREALQERL